MSMEVCHGRRLHAAVTVEVLMEARWNISEKFGEPELLRFYQQLATLGPKMVEPPPKEQLDRCAPLTGKKDAHVLAAALECGAAYLLTLDRRHLLTPVVDGAGLPVELMTPGGFLQGVVLEGMP